MHVVTHVVVAVDGQGNWIFLLVVRWRWRRPPCPRRALAPPRRSAIHLCRSPPDPRCPFAPPCKKRHPHLCYPFTALDNSAPQVHHKMAKRPTSQRNAQLNVIPANAMQALYACCTRPVLKARSTVVEKKTIDTLLLTVLAPPGATHKCARALLAGAVQILRRRMWLMDVSALRL